MSALVVESQASLLAARHYLAGLGVLAALQRLILVYRVFNPDQPRDAQGRWTSDGPDDHGDPGDGAGLGGGESDPNSDGSDQFGGGSSQNDGPQIPTIGVDTSERPQDVADRSSKPISILEEDAKGGHTYERHINKSDTYLIGRVTGEKIDVPFVAAAGEKRAGSFPSLEAADKLTNSVMSDPINKAKAEEFGAGSWKYMLPWLFVFKEFDSVTGKEAYTPNDRQQPRIRETFGVTVLLRRSKTDPRGYFVESAYPMNED